ncbi:MAG: hypothetical protein JOZ69_23310 [Myxococcales bacterium]|nr:hypothetical protein [Myxococcales bacterium]
MHVTIDLSPAALEIKVRRALRRRGERLVTLRGGANTPDQLRVIDLASGQTREVASLLALAIELGLVVAGEEPEPRSRPRVVDMAPTRPWVSRRRNGAGA